MILVYYSSAFRAIRSSDQEESMKKEVTTALLAVAMAACQRGALPPARTPTRYIPEIKGAIPVAGPFGEIGRVVLDARAPDGSPGERGRFWVYRYPLRSREPVCADVPCIIDLELRTSQRLLIANHDLYAEAGSATGYFGLEDDRNLYSIVLVTPRDPLTIMLVNVGRGGPAAHDQEPGVLVFVPPTDVQARFLPAAKLPRE